MKNWSLMAQAQGLEIPEDQLRRISTTLDALEAAFRPLTSQLNPGVETAVTYVPPVEKPE
jgi:hypothetical protein